MKITQYLSSLSQTQRIILGLVVSLSIILSLAHNPFSGYIVTEENLFVPFFDGQRIPDNWQFIRPLPFNMWKTHSPLVDWLGNIVNFISSLVAVILIGTIFIGFVFSNKSKEADS